MFFLDVLSANAGEKKSLDYNVIEISLDYSNLAHSMVDHYQTLLSFKVGTKPKEGHGG